MKFKIRWVLFRPFTSGRKAKYRKVLFYILYNLYVVLLYVVDAGFCQVYIVITVLKFYITHTHAIPLLNQNFLVINLLYNY